MSVDTKIFNSGVSLIRKVCKTLTDIHNSMPIKKGIRLQKRMFVTRYLGETWTITVQRGDVLNK